MMIVAPLTGATIALVQTNPGDQFLARGLQVVGQADFSHQFDEGCAWIEAVARQLGCLVVPGEGVMVVVPALA